MKKTLKGPAITFFALSLIFVLAWVAAFALFGLLGTDPQFDFQLFYTNWLEVRIKAFLPFFTQDNPYGFAPGEANPLWYLTYVGFAVLGIMAILMVVGLILSITRKRKRYIPFGILMLIAAVAAFEFVLSFTFYKDFLDFTKITEETKGNVLFTYLVLGFACLAYIFVIVEFFVGMARAKRLLAIKDVKPEEEKPAAPVEELPVEQPAQDVNELFATAPAASDDFVAATPVEEDKAEDYDTMADFAAEPEEQFAQPEEIVVEEVPEQKDAITKDDLASILKDVVRDIVRDEIARANAAKEEEAHPHCHRDGDHSITGATFGGPLVVQYFNGGINGQDTAPCYTPAPAPAPVVVSAPAPAPAPAPKKEEPKKEEPAPAPVVVPVPVVVEEPVAVEEQPAEKNPIIRIPFTERMLDAEKEMKDNYNELKNEIMSYGVNSRVSNSGDTFRLHRKTYVKLTIAGKSLKLYFALDPKDYADSKMPIGDASKHEVYAEIPLIFKVKSGLSVRRAKELIRDVMTKDGLEQGEVGTVNWVKELKANAK